MWRGVGRRRRPLCTLDRRRLPADVAVECVRPTRNRESDAPGSPPAGNRIGILGTHSEARSPPRTRPSARKPDRAAQRRRRSAPRTRTGASLSLVARGWGRPAWPGCSRSAPGDRAVQHSAKRLSCLEAMPLRHRQPPRVHILRRELRHPNFPEGRRRLPEQPTQLRDRHRLRLMHLQILIDQLASVIVAARPPGPSRTSTFSNALSASARVAKPPTCGRVEPRPSSRQRYAHNGCPSVPFASA
jgi:hypothetical protein